MTLLSWQRSIEQIVVANKDSRVLGITSVRAGAGVSQICRRMAKVAAVSGARTLIVSLAPAQQKSTGSSQVRTPSVVPSSHGYDFFSAYDADGNAAFASALRLSEMLDTDFASYTRILLDLPPVSEQSGDGFSAVAFAPICDRINLVCVVGSDTKSEVSEAVTLLRGAGATVSAVIANEQNKVAA